MKIYFDLKLYKNAKFYFVSRIKLLFYFILCKILRRRWTWFNNDFYEGKRVIVIGPARSSLSYLPGEVIDNFDIVVRINKSSLTLSNKRYHLGSRTDVLYHCYDEDPITGGAIKPDILAEQCIKKIVYTYAEDDIFYNFYKIICKYPSLPFCRTSPFLYKCLKAKYKAKLPTTGLQALNHILNCNFSELHITGFTFFRTAYADGYRDQYKSAEQGFHLATKYGNHDPDDELRIFKEEYEKLKNSKKIILDNELNDIIINF